MKLRWLLFGLLLSSFAPLWAQDEPVDVTALLADTKTFIFSNNRSTVKGYIYAEMQAKTSCCGSDRIYLEVKIDPSGYVLSAKTLTGRNECFMQSAIDIVKNIKWNTEDFKGGPRSVYFEIKPDIACDGGRSNTYTAVPIFNNALLSGEVAATQPAPPAQQPRSQQPENQPVAQPAAQPVVVAPAPQTPAAQPQPAPAQPQVQPSNSPEPVATVQPTPQQPVPQQPASQPQAPVAEENVVVVETPVRTETTPRTAPGTLPRRETTPATTSPTDPPRGQGAVPAAQMTEEQQADIARQEAERQRREEEIRKLKEEMARMRAAEEQVRETRLAAERQRQEQEATTATNDPFATAPGASGRGGLFQDGLPYEGDDAAPGSSAARPTDPPRSTPTDPTASQEERIRADIARMEQRIRELEQGNREVESDIRRRMADAEKANREIVQLSEEKARRQEEAVQIQEQRELDRIAENKRKVEEDRARQEQEVQRLQNELARLQSEMQTRMTDLTRQQTEIERIAMERQQREQEITLTRALREKETEAELERIRLERLNSNVLASSGSQTVNYLPDFTTAADSEKYVILLTQIQALQQEVNSLRQQLGKEPLPTNPQPQGPATPGTGSRTTPKPVTSPGAVSAATNDDWKNIDFVAPGMSEEEYIINPKPVAPVQTPVQPSPGQPATSGTNQQPTAVVSAPAMPDRSVVNYQPGRGYSPDPSHSDTHVNTAGPEMTQRTFINGETALKEKVKEDLRKGGVCGLAHVFFSVTLKPDGSVLSYRVLSANSPQVSAQMGLLIPTLKFNQVDARYNQTVYQEIKAEIVCEGGQDVNLRAVESVIRD